MVDPYENIYTVIRGAKHFTLLPPTEGWCLRGPCFPVRVSLHRSYLTCLSASSYFTSTSERQYPHATYHRASPSSALELIPSPPSTPLIRWSSVADPTVSEALPSEAHPIHITVKAGETLYLPAGWWHYVRQEGFTVAINYWYDMEGRGTSWVWLNLLRGTEDPPLGNEEDESRHENTNVGQESR